MMGQLPPAHSELFYDFCLERHVPQDHLLRQIDTVLDLGGLRDHLRCRPWRVNTKAGSPREVALL